MHALMGIADALADTDRTLRQELAKIGVEWEGAASEGAHEETQKASIYAEDAVPVVARSASGVNEQGIPSRTRATPRPTPMRCGGPPS
ncbi:hypothetical protein ACFQV2_38035 [Actinokineospora soli]|uniref:WXG100 family type VII secretion target n=1 Tax=Actinokineospora soli TaxID=1048753 RepID=A0ABW2TWM5_9PSEU